ncbi:hypothetical protein [Myxococcus vastator]|uniref:hypothetical protein n=1 Tax=Myxococcus vastator TaxID=2709664 RepID=UPI0013CF4402|nr:hypothetical protein [Myxococcus vastator]
MRNVMSVVVSLSASLLLACGPVPEAGEGDALAEEAATRTDSLSWRDAPVCGDGVCCMERMSECPSDCPNEDGGLGGTVCYISPY